MTTSNDTSPGARAQRILDGVIAKDDVTPRMHALLLCMLEALAAAADRLLRLEEAPMRYLGPHEPGRQYSQGAFVSYAGSIWHANEQTSATPGDGPTWTLACKKGRDAPRP